MPEILDRCIRDVMATGKTEDEAWGICRAKLNLKEEDRPKKRYSLPDTRDIEGVEVFASGTWNGDKYTEKDLDEMVTAYNETKHEIKPYLKLGHSEKQKLAQRDGLPSLGWIENLRRVGSKLIADFKRIPQKIYDLIERKAYARVSSEVFFDIEVMGKKFKKMLKAVALLGGDTPAVQNLNDIMALYSFKTEDEAKEFCASGGGAGMSFDSDAKVVTYDKYESPMEDKMSDEQLKKLEAELAEYKKGADGLEEMKKKMKALEEENDGLKKELEKLRKKNTELETSVSEHTEKAMNEEVNRIVDGLVNDKKIAPSQKEQAFEMIKEAKLDKTEKKFKVDDKEVGKIDSILKFFESNKIDVNTEETTGDGDRLRDEDKIKKYAEEHKCSYKEAMLALADEGK